MTRRETLTVHPLEESRTVRWWADRPADAQIEAAKCYRKVEKLRSVASAYRVDVDWTLIDRLELLAALLDMLADGRLRLEEG